MKGQSHVQLPPVIVLLLWLDTELPDISQGKVANTAMHSSRPTQNPLNGEHWLNQPSSTNLCCHRVQSLMWQSSEVWKKGGNNRYKLQISLYNNDNKRLKNPQQVTVSGLQIQIFGNINIENYYLHNTQTAAAEPPLKMSQRMWENECAAAGQMSQNILMKRKCSGWTVIKFSLTGYRLPPGVQQHTLHPWQDQYVCTRMWTRQHDGMMYIKESETVLDWIPVFAGAGSSGDVRRQDIQAVVLGQV